MGVVRTVRSRLEKSLFFPTTITLASSIALSGHIDNRFQNALSPKKAQPSTTLADFFGMTGVDRIPKSDFL